MPHPFCLDLKPCWLSGGRFVWEIRQRRKPKQRSLHTYATFDEARMAGKTALATLIVEWRQANAWAEELNEVAPA
jgi:hypothetical protein